MIEVGDLVRIRNKALRSDNFAGLSRRRYKKIPFKSFRGKQVIAKVLASQSYYDHLNGGFNQIVVLDVPDRWGNHEWMISAHWLVVHRKANNHNPGASYKLAKKTSIAIARDLAEKAGVKLSDT